MTYPATLDHTLPMLTSLFGRCIGVSAVVCVLLMFFFPLPHGNFQSTHGPTTALRAKRALLVLIVTIVAAALRLIAILFRSTLLTLRAYMGNLRGEPRGLLNQLNSALRC